MSDERVMYRRVLGGFEILGPLEEGPGFAKHDAGLPGPRRRILATVHGEDQEHVARHIVATLATPAAGEGDAWLVTASRPAVAGPGFVAHDWLFRHASECARHVEWLRRPLSSWRDVRILPLYRAPRSEAPGEDGRQAEVRREASETRWWASEAIRAARRGEGGGDE